ncbi:MAG: trypsin-like peptidase domain-containing protein, partial [Bdellovibrionales bacterium]
IFLLLASILRLKIKSYGMFGPAIATLRGMAFNRILLSLGVALSFTTTNLAMAAPGFFPVNDPDVPAAVKKAADSVFEIYFVNATSKKTFNLFTELRDLRTKVEAAHFRPQIAKIIEFQIQYCLIQRIFEGCDIYFDTAQATGFLVGDSQTLWTNFHAVEDFVESLAELFHRPKWIANLTIRSQNLPLFVFDQKGNLVFSATKARGRATLTVKPFSHTSTTPSLTGQYNQSSDFIEIKLSSPIGQPLRVAKSEAKVNDAVFMLGYPVGTGEFLEAGADAKHAAELVSRSPAPDSDGHGLKLMKGTLVPIESPFQSQSDLDLQWWKIHSHMGFLDTELDYYQLITSDSDTAFGASGSPMLNLDGEVIGMNAGGEVINENGKVQRVLQRGIRLPEVLKKLEAQPQKAPQ